MVWADRTAILYKGQPYYDVSVREPEPPKLLPKTTMQQMIRRLYPIPPRVVCYLRVPLVWKKN